jgi:glycosyltransferase involved in cell wall biosynthesis
VRFSVIVPTFNRPQDLTQCLAALTRLDYPKNEFEVIVVDDGGGAHLEPIVEKFCDEIQLTIVRQPNRGPAAARNNGAAHAGGTFLAFIDDDCRPLPEWLRALDTAVTRAPNALIGGRVVNGLPGNPNDAASQQIVDYLGEHFNRDPEHGRFFPSNNIAVPSELFRAIDGFDENFQRSASEDRDFCDRWLGRGLRLVTVPDAIVLHSRGMSFVGFCKQHFLYGGGAFHYAMARRKRNGGSVPFEGWRFHAGMILSPLHGSLRPSAFYQSLLILLSQIAVIGGYFSQARVRKQEPVPSYNLARK